MDYIRIGLQLEKVSHKLYNVQQTTKYGGGSLMVWRCMSAIGLCLTIWSYIVLEEVIKCI